MRIPTVSSSLRTRTLVALAVCFGSTACGESQSGAQADVAEADVRPDVIGSFDTTAEIPIDLGGSDILDGDAVEDSTPFDVETGDVDANDANDAADAPSSRMIDESGGSIETDFARLVVPPGAVDRAVEFSVVRDDPSLLPFPEAFRVASPMIGFLPEGRTFEVPVTVSIRAPGADERMQVWWSPIDLAFWRPRDTRFEEGWAITEVEHFSRGFVGRPEVEFCGDGIAEGEEECDGDDVREATCAAFGLVGEPVSCTDECSLELSACVDPCADVACVEPPPPICRTDVAVTFGAPSECVAGACVWTESIEDCGVHACAGGECVNIPEYGDVIVTEFMMNPEGDDSRYEWFEIQNVRPREIYIGGMSIIDDGSDVLVVPEGTFLAPGAQLTFGASIWATPGVGALDWSRLGEFELNSSDAIELSFEGSRIDRIEYDRDWSVLPAVAKSLTVRIIDADSNDDPAAWCDALTDYGVPPNLGSPGRSNPVCAVCGNGVVEPPEECDDGNTEPLDGCDESCLAEPDLCGGVFCLEPPEVDCASDDDLLEWEGRCVPSTGECVYDPVSVPCGDGSVCVGGGCRPAIAVGDIIVSEFMPIPIGGPLEQWFELTNFSDAIIDVSGMVVTGATDADNFTIPVGAILLPGTAMVFGASGDAAGGTAAIDWREHGSFSLSDASDVIELTFGGRRVHRVEYDPSWPIFLSASVQREDTKPPEEDETMNGWCLPVLLYDLEGNSGSPRSPLHDCPLCGNEIVEEGEECDDGGTADGDGCDSSCQLEEG